MSDRFEEGVAFFNRRAYFESHAAWEAVWQSVEDASDKKFLEALMRVAVALHLRFDRGGGRGTRNLLFQAMVELEDVAPEHRGVDVLRFRAEVATYAERVEEQKDKEAGWLDRWLAPKIRLVDSSPAVR